MDALRDVFRLLSAPQKQFVAEMIDFALSELKTRKMQLLNLQSFAVDRESYLERTISNFQDIYAEMDVNRKYVLFNSLMRDLRTVEMPREMDVLTGGISQTVIRNFKIYRRLRRELHEIKSQIRLYGTILTVLNDFENVCRMAKSLLETQ